MTTKMFESWCSSFATISKPTLSTPSPYRSVTVSNAAMTILYCPFRPELNKSDFKYFYEFHALDLVQGKTLAIFCMLPSRAYQNRVCNRMCGHFKFGQSTIKIFEFWDKALINWKHIGDLWSIITDWLANFIGKTNSRRSRGVRFHEDREELDIKYVLKYIKAEFEKTLCSFGRFCKKIEIFTKKNLISKMK